MTTIKYVFVFVLSAFVVLFVYANTRYLSRADKLPRITLATFNVPDDLTSDEAVLLQKEVTTIGGATACTVNARDHLASVAFKTQYTSERMIKSALSEKNSLHITTKHSLQPQVAAPFTRQCFG
jgi:hypothetical protein